MAVNDQIAQALSQSRAAHLAYRQALATSNTPAVRSALQLALDTRQTAENLDPVHAEPAWQADPYAKLHTELLMFYRLQLAK